MDVATDLVEAFLRLNGYLTVSEVPVQTLNKRGDWETLTDVDILALRFPGGVYVVEPSVASDPSELEIPGLPLFLEEDTIDVIVGEVKQGEARFNPAIAQHETLFKVLHPLSWLYLDGDLDKVVDDLGDKGVCYTAARGGGTVRTRLVAFGQATETTLNVIPLDVIISRAAGALSNFDDLFRSARPSSHAGAMLKLLHKTGFRLSRDS